MLFKIYSYITSNTYMFNSFQANMKCATYILAFIFYISGCYGNPVSDLGMSVLQIYKYRGQIDARTSADNETVSRWTVSGNLSVYAIPHKVIIKLDDVKTTLFNGNRSDFENVQEKELPEEAKVLLQPFIVSTQDAENLTINFIPSEPLWSKNFKRGIASNLNLETNMKKIREAEKEEYASFQEMSIYGRCDVRYKVLSMDTEIKYERSIRYSSCSNSPIKRKVNIYLPNFFNDYDSKTVQTITLLKNDIFMPQHLVSTSTLKGNVYPASPNSQYIDQLTKLDLLVYTPEVEIPFNISRIIDKQELVYEVGDEPTSGRNPPEKNTAVLTKQFLDNYKKFDTYFLHSPLQPINIGNHESVENMFLALLYMDVEGFNNLEKTILEQNEYDPLYMYFSLLPYVGTNAALKYMTTVIKDKIHNTNQIIATRILAIFPAFVDKYSDDLVEQLETLMNLKHLNQQSAINAGPLSFASVISHAYKSGSLTEEKRKKYIQLYQDKFIESKNYQERMAYLLGLINMADALDLKLINDIIANNSESSHIRTLALTGFKNRLIAEHVKLFEVYWPIVQNKQEPFEIRVRALDLLLSMSLNDNQFNAILKKYSADLNDPEDKQLANYLLTSLHSLQNITGFHDNLGEKATEALKSDLVPRFSFAATGNYRLAHTDENIGAYLQTRIITDPATNIINVVQISYENYGFSYDLKGYTLYVKLDGVFSLVYATESLKNFKDNISSVPELLKLLKENSFEIKSEKKDAHFEIIVFKENVAVYAVYFDELNRLNVRRLTEDLEQILQISLHASFPLVVHQQMPSDLGTSLQFTNVMEEICHNNIERDYFLYRSTWNYQSWIESYNPLLDTNIASYKYTGIDQALNFNYTFKSLSHFSWINRNNSLTVYADNFMGTSVEDEEILNQYCEKCEAYLNAAPSECYITEAFDDYEAFGFKINMTRETLGENCLNLDTDSLEKYFLQSKYQQNIDALPSAAPVMFLIQSYNHKVLFYDELSRRSYQLLPMYDEDTETLVFANLDLNFKLGNLNSVEKKVLNFSIQVKTKNLYEENNSTQWKLAYGIVWDPDHSDYQGKKYYKKIQTFNIKYNSSVERNSYKACVERDILYPSLTSDKYSLNSFEEASGNLVGKITKDLEGDDYNCDHPHINFTLTETFWSSDKDEKLKNKQNRKDYEECLENSKGLNFIAHTISCGRISSILAEYDNYNSNFSFNKYQEGETKTISYNSPFQYHRDGDDYLDLALLKSTVGDFVDDNVDPIRDYHHKKIYYPRRILSPLEHFTPNSVVPGFASSTCTITPSTIEQFSGKYHPNPNKEWFAFAECYKVSTRGLTGHTIGKNNVEFTYYANETVVNGTIKGGKIHVEVNGKEIHKTFAPEDSELKVYFLDEKIINIVDRKVNIYYNTEYVQVTINALYTNLLCGLCRTIT